MNKRMRRDVECSCEYVLPDYMGDIKKILTSKARVLPGGRFVSDGGIEITGTVEYEVLYADSENKLTAVNASSDYSVVLPTDAESYVGSAADCHVEGFSIRITGPRTMSLKSGVAVSAQVTTSAELEVLGDVFGGEREPQYVSREISVESAKYGKSLEREYAEEAERIGAACTVEGDYPAWEYKKDSPLRDTVVRVYREMYGKEMKVEAIHAGLECGIFSDRIAGLECVSLGPNMQDIHTTRERLSVSSVARTYDFVCAILGAIR